MKRRWKVMMVAPAAGLLLAGCSPEAGETPPRPDSKPAEAANGKWVQVFEDEGAYWMAYKRCDGTTLMYRYSGMIAVVPNSSECTKSETPSSSTAPAP